MRIDVDVVAGTMSADGGPPQSPIPWPPGTSVERVVLDTETGALQLGLPELAELAEIDLLASAKSLDDLRDGRPIVYLDQNQWRKIAEHLHGGPVPGNDAEGAEEILRRIKAGELLCPLSGAHIVEAGPLYGPLRRKVVAAMLAVSRGWRMRNPLIVHEDEAFHILTGARGDRPAVFSPDAHIFTTDRSPSDLVGPAEMLPLMGEVQRVLGAHEMLLEDEPRPVDKALPQRWADGFAEFARRTHQGGASPAMIRRATGGNVALTMLESVERAAARAGVDDLRALELVIGADRAGGRAPFTDLHAEYLSRRVRNVGQTWRPNDFFDAMFLPAAGAYADVVVSERNAADYLRQATQRVSCAPVVSTLADAVVALDTLDDERAA